MDAKGWIAQVSEVEIYAIVAWDKDEGFLYPICLVDGQPKLMEYPRLQEYRAHYNMAQWQALTRSKS